MSADRAAFRILLRLSRLFDRAPVYAVALLGHPSRRYHPGLQRLVRVPAGRWPFVEDAIWHASGGHAEYAHPCKHSVVSAVRGHWKRLKFMGLPYLSDATELLRRLQVAQTLVSQLLALQHKSDLSIIRKALHESPHSVLDFEQTVKVGDVLLTHPLACLFQPDIDRAVIMVSEVHEQAGYVRGIALNKKDGRTLREAMAAASSAEADAAYAEECGLGPILDAPLYLGGDLVPETGSVLNEVRWFHSFGGRIPGSQQLDGSVSIVSNLQNIVELVKSGKLLLRELRPIIGFAAWASDQLALELERGVWVRVRASNPAVAAFSQDNDVVGLEMWQNALRSAGLASLADFPRGDKVDDVLREFVDAHARSKMKEIMQAKSDK